MTAQAKNKKPQIITPECRLSFPALFKKRAFEEGKTERYEITMLFNKKTDLKALRGLIESEALKKFGTVKGVKMPILDGDEKGGDAAAQYEGHYYAHAKSTFNVAVIDKDRNDLTEEDVYAGCYGKVSVLVSAEEYKDPKTGKVMSRYVRLLLRAFMKTRDGEPFSTRTNAAEDFANEGSDDATNYTDESGSDALDLSEFGL
jgi:hypothetical protein